MTERSEETLSAWSAECEALVADEVRHFVAGLGGPEPARYTSSCVRRTATLHRFTITGASGPEDIVVKVLADRQLACAAFDAGHRLADLLSLAQGPDPLPVRTLRPLGLALQAPALAVAWTEAPSMRRMIASRPDRLTELMHRAGVALATVHERAAAAPGGTMAVSARTRRLASPRSTGSRSSRSTSSLVRRYVDFHPHNLLVADDALIVIDPPVGDEFTYIHHDMVNFLYKVQKSLLAGTWSPGRLNGAMHLVEPTMEFFRAYFATSDTAMTPDDAEMIDRYLRIYIRARSHDAWRRRDMVRSGVLGPLLRWQVHRAFGLADNEGH